MVTSCADSGPRKALAGRSPASIDSLFHTLGELHFAAFRRAVAAVLYEEREQLVHRRKLCAVIDEFAFLRSLDEAGVSPVSYTHLTLPTKA